MGIRQGSEYMRAVPVAAMLSGLLSQIVATYHIQPRTPAPVPPPAPWFSRSSDDLRREELDEHVFVFGPAWW